MPERAERLDARIFAHGGVLALQPGHQLRLHALRHDFGRHPQSRGQVGERHAENVREVDAEALSLSPKARGKFLTAFSTATAQQLFDRWSKLDKYLLVKYMDGNVKSEKADVLTFLDGDGGPAHFVDNGNGRNIPDKIQFPGYNEKWKRAVAKDNGEILRVVK